VPEATLALAWELSPQLSLGSNVSAASPQVAEDRFSQFSGSLALGIALSETVGGYVEVFGFTSGHTAGTDATFLNGGLTLLANADLQFDARAGFGFDDPRPDYFVGLGLARRF
jgi:hypothetical protein